MSFQPGATAGVQNVDAGVQISYTEITAGVTISATVEASSDTIVTAPTFTPNGTDAFFIDFYTPSLLNGATAGSFVIMCLFDNGSVIGQLAVNATPAEQVTIFAKRRLVPTAAAHIYSIRGFRAVSNGTVNAGSGGAGAYPPAFISITKAT